MTDAEKVTSTISRNLSTRTEDGQELHVVTLSQDYPTTIDDLWDACTSAERLPRWFLPVSGDLRLGGRYQFEGNAGGVIEACEKPHRVSATWEIFGAVSWVTLNLFSTPDGSSRLELVHTQPTSDHWNTFGPGAVGIGWELGLLGLARHIETGDSLDPVAWQEWTVSPEGIAFITTSSEGWTKAAVASGAEPDWAREAGARTLAFYTGKEG